MNKLVASLAVIGAVLSRSFAMAAPPKPTVVLVHGAFADASSWNGVVRVLEKDGYPAVAVANPLRRVMSDAVYVSNILASIKTPVVLVGHSYVDQSSVKPLTIAIMSRPWSMLQHSRQKLAKPLSASLASFRAARLAQHSLRL